MRPRLLALDYDGTLADDGGISPPTLEALAEAKRAGFLLGLVTGRPHDELLGICPEIGLFDLVVDENGSVLHFPGTGEVEDLGPSPPERFAEELGRRGERLRLAHRGTPDGPPQEPLRSPRPAELRPGNGGRRRHRRGRGRRPPAPAPGQVAACAGRGERTGQQTVRGTPLRGAERQGMARPRRLPGAGVPADCRHGGSVLLLPLE